MATAPRPGTTRPQPEQTIIISVRGVKAELRPADIGPRDDALVRRETAAAGLEPVSLLGALSRFEGGQVGMDDICLLWWVARRKSGDTIESFGAALDGFPTDGEVDEISFEQVVSEEDPGDPLPSAAD
jgi:hypothetical protein